MQSPGYLANTADKKAVTRQADNGFFYFADGTRVGTATQRAGRSGA